jgi:DNA end-binding protein Ku
VDPSTGEEVPYENVVKGYEISPDRYVVITPDELEALDPEKTRTIDIVDFVDLDQIDPIYFDHPYYLVPGTGGERAYELLRKAMEDAGKVAIGKVVIRSKESLVAIRPAGPVLTLETMLFPDEVVSPDSLDELPANQDGDAKPAAKRELQMAQQLIDSLSNEFDPSQYRDEYRERVLDLIERKAAGEEITVQPAPEEPARVPDLMSALEASLDAVKERDGDGGAPREAEPLEVEGQEVAASALGHAGGRGLGDARRLPLVAPLGELLHELGAERGQVVGLAAGDQPAVDDDLLVDPLATRVADVGLDAGPRGDLAAADQVALDQRPRAMADHRHRLALLEEPGDEAHHVVLGAQPVRVRHAAR